MRKKNEAAKRLRAEALAGGKIALYPGDMRAALARVPANSIDGGLTDPPYHLVSIVRRFGEPDAAPAKVGKTGAYARASKGFMGQRWDGGDISFDPATWRAVYRVLKPGAFLLAFGGTRTDHNIAWAIEQAGFEIRDKVYWAYGQGFPKSLNVAVEFEKKLCRKRKVGNAWRWYYWSDGRAMARKAPFRSKAANLFAGYGSALKPAIEPCIIARKPFAGTILDNLKRYGTGALNIDGARIPAEQLTARHVRQQMTSKGAPGGAYSNPQKRYPKRAVALQTGGSPLGRFPANFLHDSSGEVLARFPQTKSTVRRGELTDMRGGNFKKQARGYIGGGFSEAGFEDAGSAARFFYSPKAGKEDRDGSGHPTVKPVDLIEYLARLILPPNSDAVLLDCFAGTGTTGVAALRLGVRAVLIEREPNYCADIRRRFRNRG